MSDTLPPGPELAPEALPAAERRRGHLDAELGIRVGSAAVVVLPDRMGRDGGRDAEAKLAECVSLAAAIKLDVVAAEIVRIRQPRPGTLFGTGQVERLRQLVDAHGAEVVVVDGAVSPVQQRNLERQLDAKVIDRTGLILEIFGERAQTREGSLQVELAHLDYQASRLVRSWTHLERQRGGFGFLGGPGERQIETDRRLIRDRMARLARELEEVRRTRGLHRHRRQKAPYPVVALVGYTNAGKSTLFNRLTGAGVRAEDLLFATLDPTMRAISLPGVDKAILSDTVGFVSDLPTELVAAFRATLEEVTAADLVLHVRDVAHPDSAAQLEDVCEVLRDLGVLGAETGEAPVPMLTLLNKIDLLDAETRAATLADAAMSDDSIAISAATGEGLERLQERIVSVLRRGERLYDLDLDLADGAGLAWLHAHGQVVDRREDEQAMHVRVRLSPADRHRFGAR